jgi:hypothetical protein
MGRLVPRYYGKNDILTSFEENAETPYWSLWDSNSLIRQNNKIDDMDESIAMLESEIDRSIKNDYDRPVTLILHTKKEKNYTKKSEGTVLVCMCLEKVAYNQTQQNNQIANYNLYNELNALKSELNALKNAQLVDESEDEYEEDEDESFIGSVKTLLNEPVIAGLINKFLQPGTPVNNLAGIDNNNVNDILNVLFSKGVTVEHLNKLSQMPESQIKMLLNML